MCRRLASFNSARDGSTTTAGRRPLTVKLSRYSIRKTLRATGNQPRVFVCVGHTNFIPPMHCCVTSSSRRFQLLGRCGGRSVQRTVRVGIRAELESVLRMGHCHECHNTNGYWQITQWYHNDDDDDDDVLQSGWVLVLFLASQCHRLVHYCKA
jgi:hypothetical protein